MVDRRSKRVVVVENVDDDDVEPAGLAGVRRANRKACAERQRLGRRFRRQWWSMFSFVFFCSNLKNDDQDQRNRPVIDRPSSIHGLTR